MKKLNWLVNRLRQMSFAEVVYRIRRAIEQKVEKKKILRGWQPLPQSRVESKAVLFGTGDALIAQWQCDYALDIERLNAYLSGKIDFFGHDFLDIGIPVSWHTDPVTGITSPLEFGKSLDYRDDSKVGNIKFIWELGRHQHLVPVAVAYAVTGEKKYLNYITVQISSWIQDNPYAIGVHWCSSLEVSLRLVSWSLVHSLIALRDGEQGLFSVIDDTEKLGTSIYQHAYFSRYYLSLHSSANNHLIGELTGLWTACQIFDLGEKGEEWSVFSYGELERQSKQQVYDDGVNKEQASYYHLWVLEYFLFVRLVGSNIDQPFSDHFIATTERMAGFIRALSPAGGEPPQIGDADDGFVARFDPKWSASPYKDVLSVFDILHGKQPVVRSQKAFWYTAMVKGDLPPDSRLCEKPREYPEVYQQGGYAMLGDASCHIVFDGGQLGYLGIAAHGHADALSICLALDGEWWLVDPGTYAYHSAEEWRNYFRGTRAHNTIKINDLDQSTISGSFMWSHKANAEITDCYRQNGRQIVRASHDGYQPLGVTHRRECCFREMSDEKGASELVISDLLNCTKNIQAEINFHFSPDISLQYDEKEEYWLAKHKNSSRQLIFILDKCWETNSLKGQLNPINGWYSPALEEKVATWTLHGEADVSGTLDSTTRILIR